MRALTWHTRLAVMLCAVIIGLYAAWGPSGHMQAAPPQGTRTLSQEDALQHLQYLSDSLESHNRRRFLAEFDANRMADYASFRDQVYAFFEQYESFQVSYHLQQVGMEGSDAVVLANFTVDATPTGGGLPDVRKEAQLRLTLAWNGKAWKIVELSPRELFG